MKKRYLIILILILISSCKKDEDIPSEIDEDIPGETSIVTNTKSILFGLSNWGGITIDPVNESTIDLYNEFIVNIDKHGYDTYYSEQALDDSGIIISNIYELRKYFIKIDNIKLTDNKSNVIPINIEKSINDKYKIKPLNAFKSGSQIQMTIDYHYIGSHTDSINGSKNIKAFDFQVITSDSLTSSLVYCEYPLPKQYNFLQDEYPYGFIKTYVKLDFLHNDNLYVKLTDINTDSSQKIKISYDEELSIYKYLLPRLKNNTIYQLDYIKEHEGIERKFYETNYFKTSIFNKFSEKMAGILEGEHETMGWQISPWYYSLQTYSLNVEHGELLDFYEQILPPDIFFINDDFNLADISKFNYPKVVTVEMDTTLFDMNQFGYDVAFELNYTVKRPFEYIGYTPIKDFFFFFNFGSGRRYSDIKLTDSEIESKAINEYLIKSYRIQSFYPKIILEDVKNFINTASNDTRQNDSRVQRILDINKKEWRKGIYDKYYYSIKYIIPGINQVTYTGKYEFGPRR